METSDIQRNMDIRQRGDAVIALALDEGVQIRDLHGIDSTLRFFDYLRDAFQKIRPIGSEPEQPATESTASGPESLSQRTGARRECAEIPERPDMVCAELAGECVKETTAAYCVRSDDGDDVWLPKSQVGTGVMGEGESVDQVWMPQWLAEAKGLAYECR